MVIRRRSILDKKVYEMDLDITADQVKRFVEGKEHVQNIFPNLSAGEREFILNGITPEEWDKQIGKEEDDV